VEDQNLSATASTSDLKSANNHIDATFFKCDVGFLAWALWGHIPILDSAGMQSDFSNDTKKKASFG
jgi:hypothetical protein